MNSSFSYLKFFFLLIAVIFFGAIIFNVVWEIKSKEFVGNTFRILYLGQDPYIAQADKKEKAIFFAKIQNYEDDLRGKNRLEASIMLGVPIDAMIIPKRKLDNEYDLEKFFSMGSQWRFLTATNSYFYKNLNKYDIFEFYSVSRSAPRENRKEEGIDFSNSGKAIRVEMSEPFKDKAIAESGLTIEVINGTDINGLGERVSRMLSNGGYDVVSVSSESKESDSYIISRIEKKGEFTDRLVRLFGVPLREESGQKAADVSIYLGKDIENYLSDGVF